MSTKTQLQHNIKKKIMFIKGEDYYFMSYNIIIFLFVLNCFHKKRVFKDYRKLAYIIDFISNKRLLDIVHNRHSFNINYIDKESLIKTYTKGRMRSTEVFKLLLSLEKRGYVIIDNKGGLINVSLNKDKKEISKLCKSDIFEQEKNNVKILKKLIWGINILTLEKMLAQLFDNFGINRWEKY